MHNSDRLPPRVTPRRRSGRHRDPLSFDKWVGTPPLVLVAYGPAGDEADGTDFATEMVDLVRPYRPETSLHLARTHGEADRLAGVLAEVARREGEQRNNPCDAVIVPLVAGPHQPTLAAIDEASAAGRDGVEEDLRFHRAIAEATGNPQFRLLLGFLEQYQRDAMKVTRANEATSELLMDEARREHHELAEAILRRDAAAAREAARRSIVLLENKNRTLPLRKSATVALVGPLADAPLDMMGSWSAAGRRESSVTLRQGMEEALRGKGRLLYAVGANVTDDKRIVDYLNFLNWDEKEVLQDPRPPAEMIAEAVALAKQADVVVAAVGESRGMSHESSSRTRLDIPASQRALLEALKATGKPLVLVLMNGRPLDLQWESANADAILETWFSGTEGGHAIADVLFGDYNPSGKLPISFPRSVGQIPTYYNHPRVGRPFIEGKPGNYTSQYFEEKNGPLYPFGYGLSYTEFALSPVVLSSDRRGRGGRIVARVNVANTGDRGGETVVQLYIRDEAASVVRPVKELRGFQKIALAPGETRTVEFEIGEDELKFFNARLEHVVEPGEFEVQIGLDSQSVETARFTLR